MTLEEIMLKYNIIFINGNRYYITDLYDPNLFYENTVPFYLKVNNYEIYENSWKNLIPKLFLFLDSINKKNDEDLLKLVAKWGKQKPFNTLQLSNHIQVRDNLFINCNHSAVHSVFTIKMLLDLYDIKKEAVELIIKRHPIAEFDEARDFFTNEAKKNFSIYLKYVKKINEKNITTILKNIDIINRKFLCRISKGYDNFYLIDEPQTFFNYMKKTNEKVSLSSYPDREKNAIYRELNYLYDFVRLDKIKKKEKYKYFFKIDISEKNVFIDSDLDKELAEFLELDDILVR